MASGEPAGLRFADLAQWQAWEAGRRPVLRRLRQVRHRRPATEATPGPVFYAPPGPWRRLVVIDVLSASCRAALEAPLAHLDPLTTAVLSAAPGVRLPAGQWSQRDWEGAASLPDSVRDVITLGSYMPLAGPVAAWARQHDRRHVVVQHGLLTPWSPPAMSGDHLLVWTEEDGDYWSARTPAVTTEVVGSQLLWAARHTAPVTVPAAGRPIVLGQLHGTELSRGSMLEAYWKFCRRVGADYRPHPNEADVVSRLLHQGMRRAGIDFETSGRPLAEMTRPVVSIFSTGTLEAAHRGVPAWVTHPRPPDWLRDFWRRYRLAQWGQPPTPAWQGGAVEPAAAVAGALR